MNTIQTGEKKRKSILESVGTALGTLGSVVSATKGVSDLADKFKAKTAPPQPPPTTPAAETPPPAATTPPPAANAKLAVTDSIQSPPGGTLSDEMAQKALMRRGKIMFRGSTVA